MAKKKVEKVEKPAIEVSKNAVGGRLGVIEKGTETDILPGTPE